MDDERKAGAGRAVERQAEDIARRNREGAVPGATAKRDPRRPAPGEERGTVDLDDEDEDEDRGTTPV